jgi:hypothetical protein
MKQTLQDAAVTYSENPYNQQRSIIGIFADGAAWQREQGIEWISVANEKPPLDASAIMPCSVKVLITAEDRPICEGYYFPDFDGWKHSTGNWQPTHYAFINLPKTDK